VEVQVADDEDVRAAIAHELSEAGVTFDALLEQARKSRFQSERARLAWFVISSFVSES
jgi:hypothetical protein